VRRREGGRGGKRKKRKVEAIKYGKAN